MNETQEVETAQVEPVEKADLDLITQLDITHPQVVEVRIREDGTVLWVNVDGICRLRICQIGHLKLNDDRPGPAETGIDEMLLGTRAYNVVTTEVNWRAKFGRPCPKNARELSMYQRGAVATVKNCGRKTIDELEQRLHAFGLQFDRNGIRDHA